LRRFKLDGGGLLEEVGEHATLHVRRHAQAQGG
jgi:hypothetical protein